MDVAGPGKRPGIPGSCREPMFSQSVARSRQARCARRVLVALLIASLAPSPLLATAGARAPKPIGRLGLPPVRSMVYSPRTDLIAVCTGTTSQSLFDAQVIDAATGKPVVMFPFILATPDNYYPGYSRGIAFSPDGTTVAAGTTEDYVSLLDIQTGQETGRLAKPGGSVHSLAFSPDGKMLAGVGGASRCGI